MITSVPRNLVLTLVLLGLAGFSHAQPPATGDARPGRCDHYANHRQAFFGDLHVHTALSSDAYSFGVRLGPDDAYRYAFGEEVLLPPVDENGAGTRPTRIDRPLDFAAVTDHAEFFAEGRLCTDPGDPAYGSSFCEIMRGPSGRHPLLLMRVMSPWTWRDGEVCGDDDARCRATSADTWRETVATADSWQDNSPACERTTFPAWEWSSVRLGSNMHRNVVFRNSEVPERPISYLEAYRAHDLWAQLDEQCLDAEGGCDVLTIPHNSNISNGRMFAVDYPGTSGTAEQRARAEQRMRFERIVEMMQHKGDSECRPTIPGVQGAADELCGFEKFEDYALSRWHDEGEEPSECYDGPLADWMPHLGPDCVHRLSYTRYALTEGLKEETRLGVNPYQFGLMASTDTHNALAGGVEERSFPGHLGVADATASQRTTLSREIAGNASNNPGGLIGVWAEENSRDSIFDAMRRREVFGTSGPRIRPRLFAGWQLEEGLCDDPDALAQAYAGGVPMGGVLEKNAGQASGASPRFLVSALRDPGTATAPGGLLQRLQVVKGWVDDEGRPWQRVYDVAGGENGAGVDEGCTPQGPGHDTLCAVWEDPDFDPDTAAVWYARVIENPSCRYSAWQCLGLSGDARPASCDDGSVPRLIQERAWTSPIWHTP